jgi:cystathionine beta-lyase/cystathionine gamma-synthase
MEERHRWHPPCKTLGRSCGPVTPPIHQTSLFTFDSYAAFEARMAGVRTSRSTPAFRIRRVAFEAMMADLEGGEAAVGFASGMGAISCTLLALARPGMRVACVEHVYPDAYRLMELLPEAHGRGGELSFAPQSRWEAGPFEGKDLAYLESPPP